MENMEKIWKGLDVIEEEIPEMKKVKVIKHEIEYGTCPNCKKRVIAKNNIKDYWLMIIPWLLLSLKSVFLNRRAASRYRDLETIHRYLEHYRD
jgi:hypothetical protein